MAFGSLARSEIELSSVATHQGGFSAAVEGLWETLGGSQFDFSTCLESG